MKVSCRVVIESEVRSTVNFMHYLLQNDIFSLLSMTIKIKMALLKIDLSLNSTVFVTFDFDPFKLSSPIDARTIRCIMTLPPFL